MPRFLDSSHLELFSPSAVYSAMVFLLSCFKNPICVVHKSAVIARSEATKQSQSD